MTTPDVSIGDRPWITLGLWPLAGVTTVGVTDADRAKTLAAAVDVGITRFDTAYAYGLDGESDRWLGRTIAVDRDRFHVTGKVAQRYDAAGRRYVDGRPETLIADAETSLRRLNTPRFDRLLLHQPDPDVDVRRSGEAMRSLLDRGLTREVGICNADLPTMDAFAEVVPVAATQCGLNLLQTSNLDHFIPECVERGIAVDVFWTLMKGLLAGRIDRHHRFADGDSRPGYDIFKGEARERAHRVVDGLRIIGRDCGHTVAQLSIGWAVSQSPVAGALVGARRPEQVIEIAQAKPLDGPTLRRIDATVGT